MQDRESAMAMYQSPSESERLAQVRKARDAQAALESRLQSIVDAAKREFCTETAFVTLVDEDVQYLLAGSINGKKQTDRSVSFCAHSIGSPTCFVVENAASDPRFCLNPLVVEPPRLLFYAGAPIVVENHAHVGNLVVMDTRTRTFSAADCARLTALAQEAARHLALTS